MEPNKDRISSDKEINELLGRLIGFGQMFPRRQTVETPVKRTFVQIPATVKTKRRKKNKTAKASRKKNRN